MGKEAIPKKLYDRLRRVADELTVLETTLGGPLSVLGVRAVTSFSVTSPRIILSVYEFEDAEKASAAIATILAQPPDENALEIGRPPAYYPAVSQNQTMVVRSRILR